MKVIALLGAENTGKSHCVNTVYQFLLRDGFLQVPGHFRILGNPIYEDVFDLLTNGIHTVGIIAMGDYQRGAGSLRNLLADIQARGANICICACRDTAGIKRAVEHYPVHFFVNKTISTGVGNNRIVNFQDAVRLISMI